MRLLLLLPIVMLCGCTAPSPSERKEPFQFPDPQRQFRAPVATWQEVHSRNVVMQEREYTCGAASLGTVLKYYYRDPIKEPVILQASLRGLNDKDLKDREKNGLSMEDLRRGAADLGYSGAVLELKYEKLRSLEVPVVVRLIKEDFKHFVVYRGELDGRVFLADPLRGNVRLPTMRFQDQWDGKVLAIVKRGFVKPTQHALQIPMDEPVTPELQAARRSLYEPMPTLLLPR